MHWKIVSLTTSLLFPIFMISAHAADAPDAKPARIHDSVGKGDGRFTIVNMTQNQIVGAQLGDTVAKLMHPVAPGDSVQLDAIVTKPCGPAAIVVTFDDDTESNGSVDLCTVRKLTLRGDTLAQ